MRASVFFVWFFVQISSAQLPVTYQLFGPAQHDGREFNTYGTEWAFIGDALTASTKTFPFSKGMPKVDSACWKFIWTPNHSSARARLFHADNGPGNITQIGDELVSSGQQYAIVYTLDFTSVFNALIDSAVDKQIGFQMKDSLCCGNNASAIYESRLLIIYKMGL